MATNQRIVVEASLVIPDHGVYRVRPSPAKVIEDPHRGGERYDEPVVMDDDRGEW